jgi:hypothetical protein
MKDLKREEIDDEILADFNLIIKKIRVESERSAICIIKNLSKYNYVYTGGYG